MRTLHALMLVGCVIGCVGINHANTILIQSPELVIKTSPIIVRATVEDIVYRPIANFSFGEAVITLSVGECIVGRCPNSITIRREAVTPDLEFLETEWLPAFSKGETVILCLWPTTSGYSTMGLYNGCFPIERGFLDGTNLPVEEFIDAIHAVRNSLRASFPPELPRQTSTGLGARLAKVGRTTQIKSAGSHLGGEFITWDFTWDGDYVPVTMRYNSSGAPQGAPNASTIGTLASIAYSLWHDDFSFLEYENGSPFTTSATLAGDDTSVIFWQDPGRVCKIFCVCEHDL